MRGLGKALVRGKVGFQLSRALCQERELRWPCSGTGHLPSEPESDPREGRCYLPKQAAATSAAAASSGKKQEGELKLTHD